jgi:hypothetical protein
MKSEPDGVQYSKEHDMSERKTGLHRLAICASVLVGCAASLVGADAVCVWNFNLDIEDQTVYKSDHGTGVIDATISAEWLRTYAGTELGAFTDDEAGLSFGFRGDSANGSGFDLSFSALGDHILQFAYRTTATGFHDCEVQHLTSKGWQTIGAFGDSETASQWTMITVKLGNLSGETKLRLVLDGASSSSSTARFDNMMVTTVPAPASLIVLSELGIFGVRGRRGPGSSTQSE